MGFDIDVYHPSLGVMHTMYLSYNWSKFQDIFNMRNMCGHRGAVIAKELQRAIAALVQDPELDVVLAKKLNGWGHENGKEEIPTPEGALKAKFMLILLDLLHTAQTWPDARWYPDCCDDAPPLHGEDSVPYPNQDNSSDSSDNSDSE